jgi:hypothetical protein
MLGEVVKRVYDEVVGFMTLIIDKREYRNTFRGYAVTFL